MSKVINYEYEEDELEEYSLAVLNKIAKKYSLKEKNIKSTLIDDIIHYQNNIDKIIEQDVPNKSTRIIRRITSPTKSKNVSPKITREVSPTKSKNVSPKIINDISLCNKLTSYTNNFYDISSLICMQLARGSSDWLEILKVLKNCGTKCKECTQIGYKVAKSLIKVAATRVFADPEQSIIEPIVNSFDAYSSLNPKNKKIGKFGMGFFSLLYWLIGHPKRNILLKSVYEESPNNYCSYNVYIKEDGDSMVFDFIINRYKGETTGFELNIDTTKDKFTDENLDEFRNQLSKLLYLEGAHLNVEILLGDNKIILSNKYKSKNKVDVYLSNSNLRVSDKATGISFDTLLGSLFVPTVSTKTLKLQPDLIKQESSGRVVEYLGEQIINSRGGYTPQTLHKNMLHILVGQVSVATFSSSQAGDNNYLIELPISTRVPVSRDDIILTDNAVLGDSILSLLYDAASSLRNVSTAQELLKMYQDYTSSIRVKEVISKTLSRYYSENRSVLCPPLDFYKRWDKFVLSNTYDVMEVEKWLDKNAKPLTDIWYGMKVIIIPDTIYYTNDGGLLSYIFINKRYRQSLGQNWVKTIASSYFGTKLYPYISNYSKKEYEKFDKYGKIKPSDVLNAIALKKYYAVMLRLDSLNIYFTADSIEKSIPVLSQFLLQIYQNTVEIYNDVCDVVLRKMNTFTGSQIYGSSREELSFINNLGVEISKIYDKYIFPREKWLKYFLDHIMAIIESTFENQDTIVYLSYKYSPNLMISLNLYHKNKITQTFVDEVIVQTNNIYEFSIILLGVGRVFQEISALGDINFTEEGIPAFVSYMLDRIRARNPNHKTLVDIYRTGVDDGMKIWSIPDIMRDYIFTKEWIQSVRRIENIQLYQDDKDISKTTNTDDIKLSSLMRYLFSHNIPDNLEDLFEDVRKNRIEKTPLQAVEIAINEGTTKSFIDAVLTELTQNSLDAIREFNPENKRVDISLKKSSNSKILYLQVTDYVGMNEKAFLYIGIPFLSTKTPSELVAGEIGSGFFNVYRESSFVIVDSVRDNIRRISYDIPVKELDRVIDVEKRYLIMPTKDKNKTTITVAIATPQMMTYISLISRIEYSTKYILGTIPLNNIFYSNLGNTYINRELIAKVGKFEAYIGKIPNHHFQSYLTTKGIPFAPLEGYVKKIIAKEDISLNENIIINITHGGYTPVQTRTKIRLEKDAKKDFFMIILYCLFVNLIKNDSSRPYLDHYFSYADTSQLRFTQKKPINEKTPLIELHSSDIVKYTKFYDWPTLADLLNECIKVMGDRKYVDAKKDIELILTKYSSEYIQVDVYIHDICVGWLENKNFTSTPKSDVSANKKIDEITVDNPDFQFLLEIWIKVWWNLANKLKIKGYDAKMPKIRSVKSNKHAYGWYQKINHEVVINTSLFNEKDSKNIIPLIKANKLDVLQSDMLKNKVWVTYFSYGFPASTLPHELEHARRKDDHELGFHSGLNEKLWAGDVADYRTYDQVTNAIYQRLLSEGLYEKFLIEFNGTGI